MAILDLISGILDIPTFLVFTCVLLLTLYWWTGRNTVENQVPPIPGWPIIGNLTQLAGTDHFANRLLTLRKGHGDIISLRMGALQIVAVFGHKLIYEALIGQADNFKYRPNWIHPIDKIFKGQGVIFGNGDRHSSLRKFTLVTMREFGVGKKTLEERIQEEAQIVGDELALLNGRPVVLRDFIAKITSNIISGIVFGSRFDYQDPEFIKLLDNLNILFKNASVFSPENAFPWLKYIKSDPQIPKVIKSNFETQAYLRKRIQEHRESFDPNNIRDFIDLYLNLKREEQNDIYTEENVFRTIQDLFSAGSETTSTTLLWSFLYLLKYPDVYKRCQDEIGKVVGSSRPVSLDDRQALTYVNATLNEVQRVNTTAPLAGAHTVLEDTLLGGYLIPKRTVVLMHLHSAHVDPRYWNKPMEFCPERWIGRDGELLKHEAFYPFSIGPRKCLGEALARMELFLFFSNLLQRFQLSVPEGTQLPPLKGTHTGPTNIPPEYSVSVREL